MRTQIFFTLLFLFGVVVCKEDGFDNSQDVQSINPQELPPSIAHAPAVAVPPPVNNYCRLVRLAVIFFVLAIGLIAFVGGIAFVVYRMIEAFA